MRRPCTVETSSAARMGSVATLDSLHALRIPTSCDAAAQLRLDRGGRVEASRREQAGTENRSGHEIDKRDEGPHQRSRALLIFHSGKAGMPRHGKVHWVSDTLGEDKESGKDVTWKRGEKEEQKRRPLWPPRDPGHPPTNH